MHRLLNRWIFRILRNQRGTTIIEFAIVAPIFLLLMMGALEYGLLTFTQVSLETAVDEAGRNVMVNHNGAGGCASVSDFTADLQARTAHLINSANISVSANTIQAGGAGGVTTTPDICLTNPPSTPAVCPAGTPFQDNNGNGVYDPPGAANLGCSGDEVELQVNLPWQVQFPIMRQFFGQHGVVLLTATTVIKNE